jgi:Zn-dependent protease
MLIGLLASNPIVFAIIAVGIILALTIHEFAHAWVADRLGDPTPRYQGRVTLNPLAHLDPIGTAAIFLAGFGWGKPVAFDTYNLKEPVRDSALIAFAGPLSNILFAVVLALVIQTGILPAFLLAAITIIMRINVMLAIFNLVPIHPLDGSKILSAFLPKDTAYEYESFMERYGFFVLIFMILPWNGTSPISQLISPAISFVMTMLLGQF